MAERRRGPAVWIATCAGAGFFPLAPGTVGSLVGVAAAVGLRALPVGRLAYSLALAGTVGALYALGVWSAGQAEKFFAVTDPRPVIIDEVTGQMLVFVGRPLVSWPWLAAGFALFRALDVLKPFPMRRAEKLPAGWGIMTDDILAGAYSLLVLSLLEKFFAS